MARRGRKFILLGADAASLVQYVLADSPGAYTEHPISEQYAPLRLGPPEYDSRQPASTVAFPDLAGGMGRYIGNTRDDAARSWVGEADTRDQGIIALLPKLLPSLFTTQPGNDNGAIAFVYSEASGTPTLYAACGDRTYSTTGTAWTNHQLLAPNTAYTYRLRSVQFVSTAAATFTDYLMWCRSDEIYKGTGGAFGATVLTAFSDGVDVHNDPVSLTRVIAMRTPGQIYQVEFDTPAQTFVGAIGSGGHFIGVMASILYMLDGKGRIHSYDPTRAAGTFVRQESEALPSIISGCVYQNAQLALTDGRRVVLWNPARPSREITPGAPDGLPTELGLTVRGLFALGDRLFLLGALKTSRNLILNGGAETAVTGYAAISTSTVTRVTSAFYWGGAAIQMVTAGSNGFEGVTGPSASVNASTTYTITFDIRSVNGAALNYDLEELLSGVSVRTGGLTTINATSTWARITKTHTTGTGVNELRIRLYTGASPTVATIHLDGHQIEAGSTATPYRETDSDSTTDGGMVLLEFKGGGWHLAMPIIGGDWHGTTTLGAEHRRMTDTGFGFEPTTQRLWIGKNAQGVTQATSYTTLPANGNVGFVQELLANGNGFEPEAWIVTPWHSMGLRGLSGPALRDRLIGEFTDSNQSCLVEFQVAHDATGFVEPPAWTTLGTLTAAVRELAYGSGAGTAFRYIRWRRWLKQSGGSGGSQSGDSPSVGWSTEFLKVPDVAVARVMQIDLDATARTTRRTPAQVRTDLITLAEQKTLPVLDLPLLGGAQVFVKVEAPRVQGAEGADQRLSGYFTISCQEVV